MKILLASSEAVPFAKTGGLADVATGLAKALQDLHHDVTLVIPYHRQQVSPSLLVERTSTVLSVPIADRLVAASVCRSRIPGSEVEVLLIDQPQYFDRPALYTAGGVDYSDNCERFVFFSRAVLEAARATDLRPDIVHANDWQTALIPPLLAIEYRSRPEFARTGAILTIHNMAFQGRYWQWDMRLTGLDWKYFNWRQLEFWGDLNLLKGGIVFSDVITTVSPTYAREICTPEFGWGLDSVLQERGSDLVGILNGVDVAEWDPATDPCLPQRYGIGDWPRGKAACKAHLQARFGLHADPKAPLLSMITRLTDQKGLDLVAAGLPELLREGIQVAFLGTGEQRYEGFVREAASMHPRQVAAVVGFDESLAHQLEAAADIYLMPSKFEPCGLNQQYSMRYGTPPIVHSVGGLADSVVDPSQANGRPATGFVFDRYDPGVFLWKTREALRTFHDRPAWERIVTNGMQRDCSWRASAAQYVAQYERALARH
ncbi:MAG: glycogen synthase GlgA [Planctomycetaceae bacterium]